MTIMTQGDRDGTHRRCDASCHGAKRPACACICGGRYHGAGSSEAAQAQLTKDWFGDDWVQRRLEVDAAGWKLAVTAKQLVLALAASPALPL